MRRPELHRVLKCRRSHDADSGMTVFSVLFSTLWSVALNTSKHCANAVTVYHTSKIIFLHGNRKTILCLLTAYHFICEMRTAFHSVNCFAFICPEFCILFYSPVPQAHKALLKFLSEFFPVFTTQTNLVSVNLFSHITAHSLFHLI